MQQRAQDLADQIASAIDHWNESHPDVTVSDVLAALERVRHVLTEATIEAAPANDALDYPGLGRC